MADARAVKPASVAPLAALVVLPALLAVLLAWPRPAVPVELPGLALPADEVRAAIAAEDQLADAEPTGPAEEARRVLYLEHGLAEIRGSDTPHGARDRRIRTERALVALRESAGDEGVAAARAADVIRVERALAGEGTPEERAREAGRFADVLERWNAAEDGQRIAPPIVVRALAAARWNGIHGLPLTEGIEGVALRGYHGWLALHGAIGISEMRVRALASYSAAGGAGAHEALGVLLYLEGEPVVAAEHFEASYAMTGNVRVRNHRLAAILAAYGDHAD